MAAPNGGRNCILMTVGGVRYGVIPPFIFCEMLTISLHRYQTHR
jgi:hypothetical protein